MDLDRRVCDRARKSRDARFDGRFFIAVTTTRIYCRPICPARAPKDEHVQYFPTAAAAEAAGFRPCLRCRPESSPGTPAWLGTSNVVSRGLRLIGDGALDENGVDDLADRLGVTGRHLRRLFVQHLGASPLDVALTRRVHFAKKLLDETRLSFGQIAFASGFGSVRRFNGQIQRTFGRTPTALRRLAGRRASSEGDRYRFRLAFRPPYDWEAMISFLRARATPGVEEVSDAGYRRTIAVDGRTGAIRVFQAANETALLQVEVRFPDPRALLAIVERVRRMFDVAADPAVIAAQLQRDPLLRRPIARHPGIRVPGAWDGFELAVRAILGQQISVRAATTIAGRLAALFGSPVDEVDGLSRLFPTPAQLCRAPVERAGVMPARADTIRRLASAVASRHAPVAGAAGADGIAFDGRADVPSTIASMKRVPGIGDWTTQYVAMRALGEPDAWPSGDLILRRMAGGLTPRALERRADAWRPWRSYAVMLLWRSSHEDGRGGMREVVPLDSATVSKPPTERPPEMSVKLL